MPEQFHPRRTASIRRAQLLRDVAQGAVRAIVIAVLLLSLHGEGAMVEAQQDPVGEYDVKAAMLYNMMKFVEWPDVGQANAKAPVALCVAGRDPFGKSLDSAVGNKSVNGRPIEIRRFANAQNAKSLRACDVLYVSSSERKTLDQIVSGLQGADVLTVGEMNRFAERGGMVQFALVDKQVRLEVNLDAVSRTGLKISSKLLALAQIVRGRPKTAGS